MPVNAYGRLRLSAKSYVVLSLLGLVAVCLFLFAIISTVFTHDVTTALIAGATLHVRIDGVTMEPTLEQGTYVLVDKLAYANASPRRGDIVVYKPPTAPTRLFIHRVIGIPGERVRMQNKKVTINGVALDEPYIGSAANYEGEWTLGRGEYFVLGDNRSNSLDSHIWGALPAENILGIATTVYWPPSNWTNLTGISYPSVP